MQKHLFIKLALIISCVATSALQAQWSGFENPEYNQTTQYSEWEHFMTTTNATPDISNGTSGTLTETTGAGFVSSMLNIYSFSQDQAFSIAGNSSSELGQLNLQFAIWGEPESLTAAPELTIAGTATTITPAESSNSSEGSIYIEGQGNIAITVFNFFWDLSEYIVNSYELDFGLAVHTSLDKVRIDTTTEKLTAEPEPIIPINVTTSIVNGDITLSFPTHVGNSYQIKWTSDLATAGAVQTWNDLSSLIIGDGSTQQVTDLASSENDSRFYSIIITN